jgi:hypothetical protein
MAIFDLSSQQVAVPEIQLCTTASVAPLYILTFLQSVLFFLFGDKPDRSFNHAIYDHAMVFVSFSGPCICRHNCCACVLDSMHIKRCV